MRTDDLVSMLASGVAPVDRSALAKRFSAAVLLGLAAALACVTALLGIRADLAQVVVTPLFWAKIALPLCLLVGALLMVKRLARPGMTAGAGRSWVVLALLAVWLGGFYVLATTAPEARLAIVFGKTWRVCPLLIAGFSLPGLGAVFWALRGMAPTRLALTGACGGLLAGALSALVYCLHCPEMDVPFWGVWYVLGMLVPTALGALLGPRCLRW